MGLPDTPPWVKPLTGTFSYTIFLLKFLMTLARAICVCYGAARGHTSYGLEMRT